MITNSIRDSPVLRPKSSVMIALPFVLLVAAFIKIKFLSQPSLWPDEALYLFISRNLSFNPLNLQDISGGIFYQSPPLLMYILSLFVKLPLADFDRIARTVVAFMGVGTVYISYLIGKKLFNPVVGLMAAGFLAVCPLNNWIGVRILTDTPVVFFIYLAICMRVYDKKAAFYVFGICAFLTKYSAFPVLLFPLLARFKARSWFYTYAGLFLFLAVFVMTKRFYPSPDGWLGYFYGFFQPPDMLHMVEEFRFFLGSFLIVLAGIGFVLTVRERKYSALFHWFCIFGIFRFFLPWIIFRVSRYTLPIYPAFFIFAAYGCYETVRLVAAKWPRYRKWAILFFAISISSVLFDHSMKSLDILGKTQHTFIGFKEVVEFLKTRSEPHSIATASPRQIKYFGPEFDIHDIQRNITPEQFKTIVSKNSITYLCIDLWSPHLPKWLKSYEYSKNGFMPIYGQDHVYVFEVIKAPRSPHPQLSGFK